MCAATFNFKSYTFQTISSNNQSTSSPIFFLTQPPSLISGYAVSNFSGVNAVNVIDSRNNIFQFSETTSSGTVRSAVLPTGNYTISSILTALGTAMTSVGTVTYTASYSTLTNLITITSTVAFNILTALNNCYYELGFATTSTFATSQVASFIYDLSGIKLIHIVSASFGTSNSVLVNKNYNIIASIPITSAFLGVINYTPNIQFTTSQIHELSAVSFTLLDERCRVLNMSKDFTLSIYFQFD